MQVLTFEPDALKSWAQFSGDFNPIHFNDEVADRATGQGGVVVHGMLAMLSIKAAQRDIALNDSEWYQWNAVLRKAMPLRCTYAIESRVAEQGGAIRFKLTAINDTEARITGAISIAPPPDTTIYTYGQLSVDAPTAEGELARFLEIFPSATMAWMAIDAFVFARYIRYHAQDAFQDKLRRHFGDNCDADVASGQLVTMQTHHCDHFAKSLLGPAKGLNISSIEYSLVHTGEILTDDSMFATIDIPVWIGGVLVQIVQIGLMARKIFQPA